ncbi:saccharopepsin [Ranunculus cassubicifolius]
MSASSVFLTTLFTLSFLILTHGSDQKCDYSDQGSTLKVMHIYDKCSPFRPAKALSWEEDILDMAAKDEARMLYLGSLVAGRSFVPIASGRQVTQSATYIVKAKIGTPPQTLLMTMDTSSDTAWIPCSGCIGCSSTVFGSAKSTSYKSLGCSSAQCKQVSNPKCLGSVCTFNQTYGSATIAGNVSQDTFALATDVIPNYSFGCLQKVSGGSVPPQGLLGLGRGPMSLLSQSQNLYKSTFSYCLPNFKSSNFSGTLRLGPSGQPKTIKTTPLLKNPRRSSLYYVQLNAIRVGRKIVNIPPSALAFNPTTGAGTIFDSGTVFTRLVAPAYIAVRDEFRRRMKGATVSSLGGFDTCYTVPILAPTISFHFTGMNMTLPLDNILIHSTAGSTTCLAMAAAPDNVNSVLNVIANMQQQNHRILIDVPNSKLGVAREPCT